MNKIHFIGICGISMSSLAQILHEQGWTVTGSDLRESETSRHLEAAGIPVAIGQVAENIKPDMELIVYTAAVHEDNPELIAARALEARCPEQTRVIERSVLLGEMIDNYEIPIGIAGTHGKTSTSSMLSYIFMEAEADPTVTIGGILRNFGTNFHIGHSPYIIYEACEYSDSFLEFRGKVNIITNIEAEHLDYFGTLENIKKSFHRFSEIMRPDGVLITGIENAPLFSDYEGTLYTVSLDDSKADYTCANIVHHEHGLGSSFDLIFRGTNLGTLDVYVPGMHYIYDAMCAAAAALSQGISFEHVQKGLASYKTTKKRFEYKGTWNGVTMIDDYAHHPSEIKATLLAAKEVEHKELYVAFQPHLYSRTKAFLPDFVKALSLADHVVLADIYAAREKDTHDIHSLDIARGLTELGCDCHYFPTFEEIEKFLLKNISPGDLLITMGAGTISTIADSILQKN